MDDVIQPRKPRRKLSSRLIRRVDIHSVLSAQLREMIEEGELRAGLPIVETDLCEMFGVSRTPIREALKVLSSEGLVQLRRNRTPIVAPIDPVEIASIFEAVAALERRAAVRFCEQATDQEIAKLDEMQAELEAHHRLDDRLSYAEHNRDIHTAIMQFARNPVMLDMHATLTSKIIRARKTLTYDPGRWRDSVREHDGFMQAFRQRDGEAAGRLLEEHTLVTGEAVVRKLKEIQARDLVGEPAMESEGNNA